MTTITSSLAAADDTSFSGSADLTKWKYLLVFLAVKPFLDLLWNKTIVSVAGVGLTPPRIIGFMLFVICSALLIQSAPKRAVAKFAIMVFLASVAFGTGYAFLNNEIRASSVANATFRVFDAYFIYLIVSRMWSSRDHYYSVVRVIWLSTLAVNVISVFVWRSGAFNVSMTGGVGRFAGLYNDAGGPAYNSVFCLIFAAIVLELNRFDKRNPGPAQHVMMILTLPVCGLLLGLSITKSAFLMLGFFALLWFGIYKKKHFVILPAITILCYASYTMSESVQERLANEKRVLIDGDYSDRAIRSLGTGRLNVWMNLMERFSEEEVGRQLFGTGRSGGAHNQYLAYLLRCGVIGLTAFLSILYAFLSVSYRLHKKYRTPELFFGFALLLSLMSLGMFGHPFDYTTMYWYVLISISIINAPPAMFRSHTTQTR